VKVATPKKQALHWVVEQPGTVSAFEVTPVTAKLAGYIKDIAPDPVARQNGKPDAVIDIGSPVKAGQLLATLDIPDLVAEADQKAAMVELAKAELEQVRKDLAVADAQVAAARAGVTEAEAGVTRAAAEFDRWKTELAQADELVQKKVIDAQSRAVVFKQFEAARAAKAEAEARVATAAALLGERQARRTKADADVLAAAARVKVADAAVKEVEARVGYTKITAPFDGIVTDRNVHTRHLTQPAPGGQGYVLFVVARLDVVRVFVDVPEVAAVNAVPGAKAVVRVPALGGEEFAGTVTRTAGVVRPDTRTLHAEIDLPNEKGRLQPGMYAVVRIAADSADAVVVPAACVLAADETHYAYLVEGDKAVKYRVRVGRTEGGNLQVLGRRRATATTGDWVPFTGAERVVVGNLGALTDGVAVEVKE
jgi:RND family efflux transporter MFP subunit